MNLNKFSARFCAGFLLIGGMLATAVGCGGGSVGPGDIPVSGTVKFDGQPIEKGRITYRPVEKDRSSFAGQIENGSFQLKAEAGEYFVEITASRPVPGKFDETSNPGFKEQVFEMYIPEKYNKKTELKETVGSNNTHNFDLKE